MLQPVREVEVVGVEHRDPLPSRPRHSGVAGRGDPARRLGHDDDPRVAGGDDVAAIVRGPSVPGRDDAAGARDVGLEGR